MRIRDAKKIRQLFHSRLGESVRTELAERIASSGALLEGHFRLQSGLHSSYFLRFGQLAYDKAVAARIAELAVEGLDLRGGAGCVVLCAETAARFLGAALAERIGAELAVVGVNERREPEPSLRHGVLEGRANVVVATDVVTTGSSLRRLLDIARTTAGLESVRVAAFACLDESGMQAALGALATTGGCLLEGRWTRYKSTHCPLCRNGVPLVAGYEFN